MQRPVSIFNINSCDMDHTPPLPPPPSPPSHSLTLPHPSGLLDDDSLLSEEEIPTYVCDNPVP